MTVESRAVLHQPLRAGAHQRHAGDEHPGHGRCLAGPGRVPGVQRISGPEHHAELGADGQQEIQPPAEEPSGLEAGRGQPGRVVARGRGCGHRANQEAQDGNRHQRDEQVPEAPARSHPDGDRHAQRPGHGGNAAQRVGLAQGDGGQWPVDLRQPGRDHLHQHRCSQTEQRGAGHGEPVRAGAQQQGADRQQQQGAACQGQASDASDDPGADRAEGQQADGEQRGVVRHLGPIDVKVPLEGGQHRTQPVEQEPDQADQPVQRPGRPIPHQCTDGSRKFVRRPHKPLS